MPRTQEYYDRLRDLPPEDALTEHLENARLTLCAGYLPHTAPFHPIEEVGRKTISENRAQSRNLPIYRYASRAGSHRFSHIFEMDE